VNFTVNNVETCGAPPDGPCFNDEESKGSRDTEASGCVQYLCMCVFLSGQNPTTTCWNRLGVILIGDVGAVFCYSASEGGVVGV
jgi:hypothetical protein